MDIECAELPQEIIELISKRLTVYSDYLRFRCVCHSWNSYVPKTPLHLPPQLPWLMVSHNSFFDPSTNKTHYINVPLSSTYKTRICGSSFGWLVILHQIWQVRLLNPITHATISLPSLSTLPEFVRRPLDCKSNQFLRKVVLSSNPSDSDDFVAITIVHLSWLAFCRKGYESWVLFTINEYYEWMDVAFKNGLFYAVSTKGMIAVCDVEAPRLSIIKTTNPVDLWCDMHYLVFSGEDMLLVSSFLLREYVSRSEWFQILKMNWNELKWEEIQTLGKKMLFVGSMSSVSFSAADFAGSPPNRIYFINDVYRKNDFGIFSLSSPSLELLVRYKLNSVPSFKGPIWVTPNPR
ncbi:F-box protein At2g26160-like [Vicia villosa]|uniref:F-box protein At2g26160-like n=1 Tax=Vicia villosa TaxID=3911 RepID=UPI00273AE0C9|nr:F-box protein At2g26160-like [Vicia villosa]